MKEVLRFENVSMHYHSKQGETVAVEDMNFSVYEREFVAIIGPSGCGKTTLLRVAAGLIAPTSGNVTREREHISYLFQDPALLPWLTAAENVNLVLSDSKKTLPVAIEWLARVGLEGEENTYPSALSGGMRQRVALARALSTDADLLLLDEPFRGMDEDLHTRMRDLIHTCRLGKTTVIVTHDPSDAQGADLRIVFDGNGKIIIE